jgi:hypothetical protein
MRVIESKHWNRYRSLTYLQVKAHMLMQTRALGLWSGIHSLLTFIELQVPCLWNSTCSKLEFEVLAKGQSLTSALNHQRPRYCRYYKVLRVVTFTDKARGASHGAH